MVAISATDTRGAETKVIYSLEQFLVRSILTSIRLCINCPDDEAFERGAAAGGCCASAPASRYQKETERGNSLEKEGNNRLILRLCRPKTSLGGAVPGSPDDQASR